MNSRSLLNTVLQQLLTQMKEDYTHFEFEATSSGFNISWKDPGGKYAHIRYSHNFMTVKFRFEVWTDKTQYEDRGAAVASCWFFQKEARLARKLVRLADELRATSNQRKAIKNISINLERAFPQVYDNILLGEKK